MSEPIVEYRDEFNVMDFARKYAERVSRVIDEQTLANVEHQLARYGYVNVVRCRDCASFREEDWKCKSFQWRNCYESPDVEPDGYCAWAERRTDDN